MTAVKVCGLTRERDVRLAVECGAWACGFVLTESPRRVTPQQAAPLARAAAGVRGAAGAAGVAAAGALAAATGVAGPVRAGAALTVAVVTTESPEWIAAALVVAGLGAVQLSAGADGPTVVAVRAAARSSGLRPLLLAAADTPDAGDADFVLLDARAPGVYGGSGATLDWRSLAAAPLPAGRLVLAGGLAPGNVGEAIAAVRPWAVDVSSGLESRGAPGRKDEALLRAFFAAVREADAQAAAPCAARGAAPCAARATTQGAAPAARPAEPQTVEPATTPEVDR